MEGQVREMVLHIIWFLLFLFLCSDSKTYKGYKLVRVKATSIEANGIVLEWLKENPTEMDLWHHGTRSQTHRYDFLLSPRELEKAKLRLSHPALSFTVLVDDIERLMTKEKQIRQRRSPSFLTRYNSYAQIVQWMHDMVHGHSHIASVFNLTKTFENRSLVGIKIGERGFWKPAIWIDAGIHAREWIAPATALFIVHKLIRGFGSNATITALIKKFDWYIVPVANPDGYEFSRISDRFWRKTRSRNNNSQSGSCVGVDGNRNWGFHWAEVGANVRNPCSSEYAGPRAFSEKEVEAVKDFISWEIPQLHLYISLHSYGQIFLYPWGYSDIRPKNFEKQKNLATKAIEEIYKNSDCMYSHGSVANLMYPAAGTSIDFMHNYGVPYTYAVELGPEDDFNTRGFLYPPTKIVPTGRLMLRALLVMAKTIAKDHRL